MQLSFNTPLDQSILRWRWLVFFASQLIILFELYESHALDDPHLWREVFLYALILPVAIWFALTALAHNMARRARTEQYYERHRRITPRLAQYREWDELTRFVTEFPSQILPVDHTALFTYDHRNARLELVTRWDVPNGSPAPLDPRRAFDICQACLFSRPPQMRRGETCAYYLGSVNNKERDEFCLPLSYDNLLVGILRLRCQPGKSLTRDKIEFMEATSPEVALALALLLSYPRQITQVQTEAQMDERNRIAYELHNSLAQQIGYLHLSLDRLASDGPLLKSDETRDELEHLRLVAGDAYEQIRHTLALLRSEKLIDLSQAIADHSRYVARLANLQIDFTTVGEAYLLPPELCQHLFGLVRECLNNVEKHARAQHVQIGLSWSADSLCINVIDDGVGFDPSVPPPSGHYGLVLMRERAEALGGELTIDSSPAQGTRLNFRIPLRRVVADSEVYQKTFANPAVSTQNICSSPSL